MILISHKTLSYDDVGDFDIYNNRYSQLGFHIAVVFAVTKSSDDCQVSSHPHHFVLATSPGFVEGGLLKTDLVH